MLWSGLPKSYWDVALLHANWTRNRSPTSSLKGGLPIEAWTGRGSKMTDIHTFGCLVQYLRVGHDIERKSDKFASKTSFGIFLGMAQKQAGFLILDPLRANLVIRTDVKFHDSVPGYPRLVGRCAPANRLPADADFFSLFPSSDEAPDKPGIPPDWVSPYSPPLPSLPLAISLSPVIELSSDSESHQQEEEDAEQEVKGGGCMLMNLLLTEWQHGEEVFLWVLMTCYDATWRR